MFSNDSIVLLICDSSFLVESLIDKITEASLKIIVISKRKNILTKRHQNNKKIYILKSIELIEKEVTKIDYLIYFNKLDKNIFKENNLSLITLKREVNNYKKIVSRYKPKSAFLLQGVSNIKISEERLSVFNQYSKTIKSFGTFILYGDLISFKKDDNYLSDLHYKLKKTVSDKKIKINLNKTLYPILNEELSFHIIRLLFSLKAFGKSTFITGRPIKEKILIDIIGEERVRLNKKYTERETFPYDGIIVSKKQSKTLIKEVYKSLGGKTIDKENGIYCRKKIIKRKQLFTEKRKKLLGIYSERLEHYWIKFLLTTITFIFILPPVLITLSLCFLYLTKITFDNDYLGLSSKTAIVSLSLSNQGYIYTSATKQTPLVGDYFDLFVKPSLILKLQAESAVEGLEIVRNFSEAFEKIYLREGFDSEKVLQKLIFDIDIFYQKLGFLESELSGNDGFGVRLACSALENRDLAMVRHKTLLIRNLVDKISLIVGADKPKKYAFIFQNNSNIRPTGGLIESLAIIDFSGSKITNEIFVDVSWFDKNLSGDIEPPSVLKKYFGVDRWYFKDSNWDPDFPSSATWMLLLLEKGLDVSLDGIIALDKEFILKYLKILDEKIDKDYLDEYFDKNKIRESYPDDSKEYPLTSLLKNAFSEKIKLDSRKSTRIIKELFAGFDNENIQVFLKDSEIQNDFVNLSWDGSFIKEECFEPCYADFVSLIESNYEGEYDNVLRRVELSIDFQEGLLKRKLNFYLENKNKNSYKAYLRLFTNGDIGFAPVKLKYDDRDVILDSEINPAKGMKEAGVYLEIESGKTLEIVYNWEGFSYHDFDKEGEYYLFLKKQKGSNDYPVEVSFMLPEVKGIFFDPEFILTEEGVFRYNTSLDHDLRKRIFW